MVTVCRFSVFGAGIPAYTVTHSQSLGLTAGLSAGLTAWVNAWVLLGRREWEQNKAEVGVWGWAGRGYPLENAGGRHWEPLQSEG